MGSLKSSGWAARNFALLGLFLFYINIHFLIEKISKIAKKHGVHFLIDGSQSAGHMEIDLKKTGVDALAIAVGNAHGAYKLPPKLDFERIKTIAGIVDVPLVLHGGSGLTDDDFKKAMEE